MGRVESHRSRWTLTVRGPYGPDSSITRAVLMALAAYADQDGGSCWPSTRRLAAETGYSTRTVEAHLRLAVADGWIVRRRRGPAAGLATRGYSYQLTIPAEREDAERHAASSAERMRNLTTEDPEPDGRRMRKEIPVSSQRDSMMRAGARPCRRARVRGARAPDAVLQVPADGVHMPFAG